LGRTELERRKAKIGGRLHVSRGATMKVRLQEKGISVSKEGTVLTVKGWL